MIQQYDSKARLFPSDTLQFYSFSQVEVWSEVSQKAVPEILALISGKKGPTLSVTGRANLQSKKQGRK